MCVGSLQSSQSLQQQIDAAKAEQLHLDQREAERQQSQQKLFVGHVSIYLFGCVTFACRRRRR